MPAPPEEDNMSAPSSEPWPSETQLPNCPPREQRELLALAAHVALLAGAYIRDYRPADLQVTATKTSATDIVTQMDAGSEALIRKEIARNRPEDSILGEEDGHRAGTSGITWVIDPIDGTVNYLYNQGNYSVSIAACVGDVTQPGAWRPLAAAVYDPSSAELFIASSGSGAYLFQDAEQIWAENATADIPAVPFPVGKKLRVNTPDSLAQTLVATGFAYKPALRARQGRILAALLPKIRDIRRHGSAALDLCAVAAGKVDAYTEANIQIWDMAAGALIATEAGAYVGGASGKPADTTYIVAAWHPIARLLWTSTGLPD